MIRELSDAQVREQALALDEYVKRGGAASRWLESKEFVPADRSAVLREWWKLDEESA